MSNDEGRRPSTESDHAGTLRQDARDAGGMLLDDVKHMAAMALPVVLGAVIGYLVADVTGLFIGAGVGLLLIGLYLLWGVVEVVRDSIRWVRRRGRSD